MGKYIFDIPGQQSYWETNIVDADLEKLEFDKNFGNEPQIYNSILDDEPVYHSLMNFQEFDEDALYADQTDSQEDEEDGDDGIGNAPDEQDDRESYKTVDQDNMYYFI